MWHLAMKNLLRDKRRTVVTVVAVCTSILGLNLFWSYVRFIESMMAAIVIYRQGNGHIQVYKKGGINSLYAAPEKYSLGPADQEIIRGAATGLSGTVLVTPQMEGVGIIQGDTRSAIFLASGVVPNDDEQLRRLGQQKVRILMDDQISGTRLTANGERSLLATSALAQTLSLPAQAQNTEVQLSAVAFDGRLNAVEAPVSGRFSTAIEETENKSIKVPLSLLQELYRTKSVSRMAIVLSDRSQVEPAVGQLRRSLGRHAADYEITTWRSPSVGKLYDSVMGFLSVVFAFTGIIVIAIAVLAVLNTISTSVMERLREIGTLRAIGFGKQALAKLFAREAVVLAAIGGIGGSLFAVGVGFAISWAKLGVDLPRMSIPVPINLNPGLFATLSLILVGSLLAALVTYNAVRRRMGQQIIKFFQPAAFSLLMFLALGIAAPGSAHAGSESVVSAVAPEQLRAWLREADRARGSEGHYSWTLTVSSYESGAQNETIYRVDVAGDRALATTRSPAGNSGEVYLIKGRGMWFSRPGLRRPLSISPHQRLMGNAANGDIAAAQYGGNYEPALLGEELLEDKPVYKLLLTAKTRDVAAAKVLLYLDKRTHLALRAELLTASGSPFKTVSMTYANQLEVAGAKRPFISTLKIVENAYPDHYSVLTYRDVTPAVFAPDHFELPNKAP